MLGTRISVVAHHVGFALLLFSAVLWLTTTIFFVGLWDQVAAITTFPQWMWTTVGVTSAAIAWRPLLGHTRLPVLLILLWLLTAIYFADNFIPIVRGFLRGAAPSAEAPPGSIRVVSLNCATLSAAAQEAMRLKPGIVFLQECPPSNKVAQLAREWFGSNASWVIGWDCAIVSRYSLSPAESNTAPHYTRALLMLPRDRQLLATSLRLTPPLGSMDLWRPATWRAYAEDRRLRKQQLRAVLQAPPQRSELPEIIAGDFNAPAGDGIYKLMHHYRDSHRSAGRGWGGTALNNMPIFRPDQIRLKGLTAISSYAVATANSDHRMAVADVL